MQRLKNRYEAVTLLVAERQVEVLVCEGEQGAQSADDGGNNADPSLDFLRIHILDGGTLLGRLSAIGGGRSGGLLVLGGGRWSGLGRVATVVPAKVMDRAVAPATSALREKSFIFDS